MVKEMVAVWAGVLAGTKDGGGIGRKRRVSVKMRFKALHVGWRGEMKSSTRVPAQRGKNARLDHWLSASVATPCLFGSVIISQM